MSSSQPRHNLQDPDWHPDYSPQSPRHGFQGDRGVPSTAIPRVPIGLTVAFSRETGSRGGSIANRVGRKLGWQVYNQELLEYIAQEGALHEGVLSHLPAPIARWPEEQLDRVSREIQLDRQSSLIDLVRTVLTLAAQGEVVLIGRGASYILPRQSTLNVRIIAPLEDRIAYMSQWQRLTLEEAAEQVRQSDQQRTEFITGQFHRQPNDIYQYDLLLNSSLLGEDLCTELIVQAARTKIAAWSGGS